MRSNQWESMSENQSWETEQSNSYPNWTGFDVRSFYRTERLKKTENWQGNLVISTKVKLLIGFQLLVANLQFQLSWYYQITLLPPPTQHHSFFRNLPPRKLTSRDVLVPFVKVCRGLLLVSLSMRPKWSYQLRNDSTDTKKVNTTSAHERKSICYHV